MKFTQTNLSEELIRAATDAGFTDLTEIQEKCLQPALEGYDIAGISQTGTGKTVAFLLPLLDKIYRENITGTSALIVTPTRELCVQISEEAARLTRHRAVKICTIYGGEGYAKQEECLAAGPDLIVATPGRLIDYLKQNKIKMESLKFIVLDEADRMFDMGFIRDIRFIMKRAPENVQTMLFSATLSYDVMRLASDYMKDMVEVRVESETVAVDKIDQSLLHLARNEKMNYLTHLILNEESPRFIVFTNLKTMVPVIVSHLHKYGIRATGLSSMLDQKKRLKLLMGFKEDQYNILVATDVASRGLDVDDVTHVINYDLPQDAETYVHRIGRTARAGKSGISVTFCSEADYDSLPKIERYLGRKIAVGPINGDFLNPPSGDFTPFRDPLGGMPRPERNRGEGRSGQGRDRRGRRDRDRKRPVEGGQIPAQEVKKTPVQDDTISTVRAMDRKALLERMDVKERGKRPERERTERERKPEEQRRGEKPQRERGPEGRGGERERRRDDQGRGRERRPEREEREGGRRGRGRQRRPQRERVQQKKKEGILSKIISFFKK
jgi:ATP-dependent RNA helicase RhlB